MTVMVLIYWLTDCWVYHLGDLKVGQGWFWLVHPGMFLDWIAVADSTGGGCASMWSRIFWMISGSVIRRRPRPMTRIAPPHKGH